jgi:hypothetical protein
MHTTFHAANATRATINYHEHGEPGVEVDGDADQLKGSIEWFYHRPPTNLILPDDLTMHNVGISIREFTDAVMFMMDGGNIASEMEELRGQILPRQTFHRLVETASSSPWQIREAVGERTIRYSILLMTVQFKRMYNPFFSATRRMLLKLGSLRDAVPTSAPCNVCFEPLTANCIRVPACTHTYHRACLAKWFKFSKSGPICPTCRATAF